jgi:hypothetical protein
MARPSGKARGGGPKLGKAPQMNADETRMEAKASAQLGVELRLSGVSENDRGLRGLTRIFRNANPR